MPTEDGDLHSARRVHGVFLASPSDLEEERRASKELVVRLNDIVREQGWTVDLLGWEDRLPGHGRPQTQINQDVDACDLFVGVLWKRWGSPTGVYDSGFEEEFELALERRRETGSPEIWIFFKQVDPAHLEDPGEQLKRVIEFKRKLSEGKEHLYVDFASVDDWKERFYDSLLRWINKLAHELRAEELSNSEKALRIEPSPLVRVDGGKGAIPAQLQALITEVAAASAADDVDLFQGIGDELGGAKVSRFYLLAATWMTSWLDAQPLDNHSTNFIYRFRADLDLMPGEVGLLNEIMISNANKYVPGWFWLREMEAAEVDGFLRHIALLSLSEDARIGAFAILGEHQSFNGEPIPDDVISGELGRESTRGLVEAIMLYAAQHCSAGVITALEIHSEVPATRSQARIALLSVLARTRPDGVLEMLTALPETPSPAAITVLRNVASELSKATLEGALAHSSATLRQLAASELQVRELMSKKLAEELVRDKSSHVRAVAIRRLIALGSPPTLREIESLIDEVEERPKKGLFGVLTDHVDKDELIVAALASKDLGELEKMIDWFSVEGRSSYAAMARSYRAEKIDQIRADLDDEFKGLKEKSLEKLRKESGADAAAVFVALFDREGGLSVFVEETFAAVALTAIGADPMPEDAERARKHLQSRNGDTKRSAVAILAKFGDEADVAALTELGTSYHSSAGDAASAVLHLAPDRALAAQQFLDSGKLNAETAALEVLEREPELIALDELEVYLHLDQSRIRMRVVKLLAHHLERDQIEGLLERYSEARGTYYYDVVTYLDRALYAPVHLR